jgi:hypothetical protein
MQDEEKRCCAALPDELSDIACYSLDSVDPQPFKAFSLMSL